MTTGSKSSAILKDVVAYVDVWSSSKTENYSKPFIQQLQEMGAEVSKTLNKQVTHVVFKNGHHATWNKAKKLGVRLVSVLWVARCKDDGEHVDEELWPALNDEVNPAIKNKAHRCMQPKDTPERTPENDRRMKKKLDKMIKDLVPKSPLVTDVSPYIIDEVNGIVYSPSLKRADYMAQRLKDMKEKRENLSPTASQMRECRSSPGLRPSPGSTPTASILHLLDEDSDDDFSSSTGAKPSSDKRAKAYQCEDSDNNQGVKNVFDNPWLSPCSHVSRPKSSFHIINSDLQEGEKWTTSCKKSKGISVQSDQVKKTLSLDSGSRPASSRNDQLEAKSVSSTNEKGGPSSKRCKMTKSKREKTRSITESQTNADLQVLNSRSCPASTTLLETAHVPNKVSKEIHLPSLIVSKQKKQPSASARSSTVSKEPASATTCATTDENDEVFKDYFSPSNHRYEQQRPVFPSLLSERTMKVPFNLEPNPWKRKRKTSQTPEPESTHAKRKKDEEMHNVARISQDSISVHSILDPQEKPITRRSRLVTMPVTSCSPLPAEPIMQRSLSIPAQLSKPSVTGDSTTYQQSDTGVISYHKRSEKKTCQINQNASRGTEYVAAGLASNGFECKQVGVIDKSQDMDKKTKKFRTLVLTSMSTEKQQTVTQVVAALGGFSVVDQVCDSTTHVVSGGHRRTLNILLGIARGCWILSFEWILWCLEQRQWIPEEPYELSEHFPAAPICRLQQHLSAGEHQQDLFDGQPVMFVSHHSQPPTQSMVELIQLCGGTVCKTVRQAGICIGEYKGKRPEGCRILSEQWVLDCITHLNQLPYDSYDLE